MDEGFSVGDTAFQDKSRKRMMELMGGSTMVLFVNHSLQQIESLYNLALWLDRSNVTSFSDAADVRAAYLGLMGIRSML